MPVAPLQLSASQQQALTIIQTLPEVPPDVKARFPSMQGYEDGLKQWVKNLIFNLQGSGSANVSITPKT